MTKVSFRGLGIMLVVGLFTSCATSTGSDPYDDVLHGTIAYPFAAESESLGREPADEKFVIRSAVGAKEYTIEIPGGAKDYDVYVPLAEIGAGDLLNPGDSRGIGNPATTDRELVSALPDVRNARPTDAALLDSAMGVGTREGPSQAPSYSLGISKINQLFKERRYEFALIEINTLLAFFPNSPQLLKMKGTVLLKSRNFALAELAWLKALELSPRDKSLRQAVRLLQKRILAQGGTSSANALGEDLSIPAPVSPGASVLQNTESTGH